LPEVLRAPDEGRVRVLSAPAPVLDPATAQTLEREVAAAREQGRREGEQAGRAAGEQAARDAAAAVASALDALHAEVVAQRQAATTASLQLAVELAADVLERTPPDDARTLLARVEEAADALDDPSLDVRLHPDDLAALDGAGIDARLQLVADPGQAPGEARIVGTWGGAELTRARLLEAAVQARGEEGR
jgi:flagellar biosynthesis/type III secretory pathway protein FliH